MNPKGAKRMTDVLLSRFEAHIVKLEGNLTHVKRVLQGSGHAQAAQGTVSADYRFAVRAGACRASCGGTGAFYRPVRGGMLWDLLKQAG